MRGGATWGRPPDSRRLFGSLGYDAALGFHSPSMNRPEVPGTRWRESTKLMLNPTVDGMFYWRFETTPHFGRGHPDCVAAHVPPSPVSAASARLALHCCLVLP